MLKTICRLLFLLLPSWPVNAQLCTFPGQTPESAILVCGSETFIQNTPTLCGTINIPVPCPGGFTYQNTNPSFFKVACFNSGTLGFTIVPDDPLANYDWQLFDITNINPNSIFSVPGLFVACNWSSEAGETGASNDGNNLVVCGGTGEPLFSKMPDIVAGRSYLLMVCNQSSSPSNYQLTFTGGSASITDNIEPHLLRATLGCDRRSIIVRINKNILCNSIAIDGSDFVLSGGAAITSAIPGNCTSPLGTDSITLVLDQILNFGNYTISLRQGSDGNTLSDICQRLIPPGEILAFISGPIQPTPMDSVYKTGCSPRYIELVFKKSIQCSSIAPDGSDFSVTGPQQVNVSVGSNVCNASGSTTIIRLNFQTPITTAGDYQVRLNTGTDGNTILDACGLPTPAGSTVSFSVKDPVSSIFNYSIPPSCIESKVDFFHDGNNNTSLWKWEFGDGTTSDIQNPSKTFASAGTYKVHLTVSNGKCTDTSSVTITVGGKLDAVFDAPSIVCPEDTVVFINKSSELFDQWSWNFGNGTFSTERFPPSQRYAAPNRENFYTIILSATNTILNCSDTAIRVIKVLNNCYIAVPSAFTPNGDGKNDYLYPLNAVKADKLEFRVYNRMGQLVFITRDWTQKWDGKIRGVLQQTGVYAWTLSFMHHDTGKNILMKGTTVLIR